MSEFDFRILDGLRVVAAIVNSGSFAKAGDVLDMTQSGVSRSVARLELKLGIRLFDRTTRSVRLTDEGHRFFKQAMPLLNELVELTRDTAQGTRIVRGRLRINVDPFYSRQILASRLGQFLEMHSDLQVELVARDHLGDLVADGFDLAVRFGMPKESSLVARKLLETRIITAASPAYIARHGQPANPKALKSDQYHCIQFRDPYTGNTFPWEFHRKRSKLVLEIPGQLTVNEAGTLQSVCCAGYGIAQMMELGAQELFEHGKLVDLFPTWSEERFPLYIFYPSRTHLPAKTRAFVDFLLDLS